MTTSAFSSCHDVLPALDAWSNAFDELFYRIGSCFARQEAREHARAYLQGLLSSVERKNGWQIAEFVGDTTPYGLQHLLGRAVWDADHIRDALRTFVVQYLADPEAVLVLDETGFLKKGDKSCGVARQYTGTAGRIENAQVGVFLTYASSRGHTFLDRRLYLPKEWTQEKERCKQAGVPDEVEFTTKPKLARAMLEAAFAAGVPARWVTGDSVYGNDRSLQLWLQERNQAYVLAVTGQESVWIGHEQCQVKELVATASSTNWEVLSAGDGSKGPRLYEWQRLVVNCIQTPEWNKWVLLRRSLSDPTEVTAYVAFAPADTSLATLAQVAGSRWTIESCFEEAKGEVGLDQYEVRSWHGWYRHITLSMLAHAFLTVLRATASQDAVKKGLSQRPSTASLQEFKRARGLVCD